ncbi:MAG: GGDEF domain-containing protein [Sandaracinaceae bacterium]
MRLTLRDEAITPRAGLRRDRPRLVVVSGEGVGLAYPVVDGAVIGRAHDAAIRIPSDDVSRAHARLLVQGEHTFVEDLGSMNGTLVNGEAIAHRTPLRDGDKLHVGTTVLRFALFDDLDERFQARMYESALRDPLTRAFNRKYLEDRVDSEFAYSIRHDTPLSLLLIDVDHFKSVNDSWGHLAGDAALVQLVEHLLRVIRVEDVLARYGGEEFAILSRGIDADGARQLAERVRASVERTSFLYDRRADASAAMRSQGEPMRDTGRLALSDLAAPQRIPLTVSIGVATMPDPEIGQPLLLVQRADDALYRAKNDGRNRVRVYGRA